MRSILRSWVSAVAVLGAVGGAVQGCSNSDSSQPGAEREAGRLGLSLLIAPGVAVNLVHYEVTGNGITPVVGDIDVSDPGASVSALIGGLPEAAGYHIQLSASSSDGTVDCSGGADFGVTAGTTTAVSIDMQCAGEELRGSVVANGTFNSCPVLTSWIVAPLQVSIFGTIDVSAAASELDAADTLSFAWTASSGTFADSTAANTDYLCTSGGTHTLTVTVSDGSCEDSASADVSCLRPECGDGLLDALETCDDGNRASGDGCPSDCSLVCGDSVIEESETCDDGNTQGNDSCPSDCTLICGDGVREFPETCDDGNIVGGDGCSATCSGGECGDGVPQAGEQCDDGNAVSGDGCESNCTLSMDEPSCGDGFVEDPEECDKGTSVLGSFSCSHECQSVASDACLACELAGDCGEFVLEGCAAVSGGAPNGQLRTNNCYDVLECVRDSGCGRTGSITECYCGTLPTGVCVAAPNSGAGAPNGPCKEVIEDALETESPQQVLTSFTSLSLAGGWALSRVTCSKTQCLAECFP